MKPTSTFIKGGVSITTTPIATLEEKVKAACFLLGFGVEEAGVKAKLTLLSPKQNVSDLEVSRETGQLLGSVLAELLQVLPPEASDRISKQQLKRFGLHDEQLEPQGDKNHMTTGLHPHAELGS